MYRISTQISCALREPCRAYHDPSYVYLGTCTYRFRLHIPGFNNRAIHDYHIPFLCSRGSSLLHCNSSCSAEFVSCHSGQSVQEIQWVIHYIADIARQKASWVLSVFHTRCHSIMLTLYKSMVRSLIEYYCPFWHPLKISDTKNWRVHRKRSSPEYRECAISTVHYWDRLVYHSLISL